MLRVLLLIIFLFASINLYAKNPIPSPSFDDIRKEIIADEKYVFDDKNILIKVPKFADNPLQVPIFVDAKKIKNAKRLILFADFNPITKIIDMDLEKLLPTVSLNIKVAQETPIRALVLDKNGLWHIGSENIKSFGGGCSVGSLSSLNEELKKLLGKGKISVYKNNTTFKIKSSIFHPMETGLVFGNEEFYINKIRIKTDKNIVLSTIKTYSSISENPRFTFETKEKAKNFILELHDTSGNEFLLSSKK